MTRIAIVGGHGRIAQLLITELVDRGHQPLALVRKAEQTAELQQLGAETALLDIEQDPGERFGELFDGVGAVVFAAGGGGDGNIERKRTVDLGGSLKSIAGATSVGVKRFVQISAIGVDAEIPEDTEPVWRAYVEAKRDADAALRDSDLDWTIIRPGGLTDDPATGQVALAPELDRAEVSRADVAAVLAAALDDPRTIGHQWTLTEGSSSISDAIDAQVS
jgi:uncharacterized protein YbjT (DUF2867 family)